MAFTEPERVKIRLYMRWPPGHTEPRYDSQIQRIQSITEGGVMSDSSTEDEVRRILTELAGVQTRLGELRTEAEAGKVDELDVDPARAMSVIRGEGRRLVSDMACLLDAQPLGDAFRPAVTTVRSVRFR